MSSNPMSTPKQGRKRPLRIYYYDVVAAKPLDSQVETFEKRTRAERRSAGDQPAPVAAPKPLQAENDQICDNCGCDSVHVKHWDGDLEKKRQILCNTCGSYFKNHKLPRPESDWNPALAPRDHDQNIDSEIPLHLRTLHPEHTYTTFLEAYTNHLRITLQVRDYLDENFDRAVPPALPPRYKLEDYELTHNADDLLTPSEGSRLISLIARHLYNTPQNWDDVKLWIDIKILMDAEGIMRDAYRFHELAEDLDDAKELRELSREMMRLDELGVQREVEWWAPGSPGRFGDVVVEALGYMVGADCDDWLGDRFEE